MTKPKTIVAVIDGKEHIGEVETNCLNFPSFHKPSAIGYRYAAWCLWYHFQDETLKKEAHLYVDGVEQAIYSLEDLERILSGVMEKEN